MKPLRLSKSGIGAFTQCPKKYYFQYVERKRMTPNALMTMGKNLHEKYESFYNKLPEDTKNINQIWQVFQDCCLPENTEQEKGHLANFLEMNLTTFEDLKKQGNTKDFAPIAIEQKYYDEDLDFVGVIDAVFKSGDKVLVVDWKSSLYKEGKESGYRFELAGYNHLWDLNHPDEPATHWGIFFTGNGVFWVEECKEISSKAFYKKLEKTRKEINECLKIGEFKKGNNSMCQWCGYFADCWEEE